MRFALPSLLILTSLVFPLQCTILSNISESELYQSTFTKRHLEILKNETRSLFDHAWNSYMTYGFPFDEVNPLICKPNKPDFQDITNKVKNDVMGNFSLTLFDSLDTFVIMNDKQSFEKYVALIKETYTDFDIDSNVQVFETNIRILGGLLSAHLYADDPRKSFQIDHYDGFLLRLAYDLGKRLILAFDNDNGIPFPRTNLRKGPKKLPSNLQVEQCTAGITSLILEFSLLSRLTNDPIFEQITRRSFFRMWESRTDLNLLPMSVDTKANSFTDQITGIGASIDSFYEYALKYSILFNDESLYDIWSESYKALLTHSQNYNGVFTNVHVSSGVAVTEWIDALGAFFPGLMCLAGDITNSIDLHLIFLKLWNYYGVIPERWNFSGIRSENLVKRNERPYKNGDTIKGLTIEDTEDALLKNSIGLEWYPLRPEFIESTYYLYRATKDPFYLRIGESILNSFKEEFMAPCGFSGILNILSNTRQDRMESFVLSETLKYLYLLFDEENDLHDQRSDYTNVIFSTEGHPFWFDKSLKVYDLVEEERELKLAEMLAVTKEDGQEELKEGKDEETIKEGILDHYFKKLFGDDDNIPTTKIGRDNYRDKLFNEFKASKVSSSLQPELYLITVTEEVVKAFKKYHVTRPQNLTVGAKSYVDAITYHGFLKPLMKEPDEITILNNYKLRLDPDYLDLNHCDVFNGNSEFLSSKVLKYPKLYDMDNYFQISLRRPPYRLNATEIELYDKFYNNFGSNELTCQVPHDTLIFEASIGNIEEVSKSEIYRIVPKLGQSAQKWFYDQSILADNNDTSVSPIIPGDLFIKRLDNYRLTFEKLEVGKLDDYGEYITPEYIGKFFKQCNEDQEDTVISSVLRVIKFNGIKLESSEIIWVSSEWFKKSNSGKGIWFNAAGIVLINGEVVENMRVLVENDDGYVQ